MPAPISSRTAFATSRSTTPFVTKVKASGRCYTPTLMREVSTYVYESTPPFFSDSQFLKYANQEWVAAGQRCHATASRRAANASAQKYKAQLPVATRNMKKLADAGVPIAMGTDTGPMGRFQGYFELMELEMMVKAGMSTTAALNSANAVAARCMGLDRDLGTLESGKWADFVVLEAEPARQHRQRAPHQLGLDRRQSRRSASRSTCRFTWSTARTSCFARTSARRRRCTTAPRSARRAASCGRCTPCCARTTSRTWRVAFDTVIESFRNDLFDGLQDQLRRA